LPDILVKGGDYRPEQVAGGDCVLHNGGEVRILSYRPGNSTSAIAARLGDISGDNKNDGQVTPQ
jgi:D-beta-D-heptose 7-phosphate kinase/D-beta-D-heptose 1-phosphate adenosyltransferase